VPGPDEGCLTLLFGAFAKIIIVFDGIDPAVCTENLSSGVVVVKSAKDGV
jgi:hypothetical protein